MKLDITKGIQGKGIDAQGRQGNIDILGLALLHQEIQQVRQFLVVGGA